MKRNQAVSWSWRAKYRALIFSDLEPNQNITKPIRAKYIGAMPPVKVA
jgi:hypothetical protein